MHLKDLKFGNKIECPLYKPFVGVKEPGVLIDFKCLILGNRADISKNIRRKQIPSSICPAPLEGEAL